MANEVLVTLVAVLATAVLAIATLAGAYLLRRIHDVSDRMLAVEMAVERFKLLEQDLAREGRQARRRGGR